MSRRFGFTLMEMLLSLALAALLSLACAQLAGSLFRNEEGPLPPPEPPAITSLLRLLERDLTASLLWEKGPDSLRLIAHRSLNERVSPHRLSVIDYSLRKIQGRPLLFRSERPLAQISTAQLAREIAALGVASFSLTEAGRSPSAEELLESFAQREPARRALDLESMEALPPRIEIQLQSTSGAEHQRKVTLR